MNLPEKSNANPMPMMSHTHHGTSSTEPPREPSPPPRDTSTTFALFRPREPWTAGLELPRTKIMCSTSCAPNSSLPNFLAMSVCERPSPSLNLQANLVPEEELANNIRLPCGGADVVLVDSDLELSSSVSFISNARVAVVPFNNASCGNEVFNSEAFSALRSSPASALSFDMVVVVFVDEVVNVALAAKLPHIDGWSALTDPCHAVATAGARSACANCSQERSVDKQRTGQVVHEGASVSQTSSVYPNTSSPRPKTPKFRSVPPFSYAVWYSWKTTPKKSSC
mmetsp:Transcript_120123/g.384795  ORF Transcript_120123/g.384795 Transcript_120123/m.384795 type:complete len:282 (+) Transcript_120123:818-1663(+)